jgi:AsmA protein
VICHDKALNGRPDAISPFAQTGECEFVMATAPSPAAKSRRFPLWAKILAGLFVVLLLIALALPYLLNVDRYRETIVDALAKQTGRKVTLGQIRAQILPGIGVTLGQLHIANPSDFPAGDVVSADEIRVNVAIAPLLHGIIHVNSIDLVRPKLTLLTNSSGKNNYTFTPVELGPKTPAAAEKAPPKSGSSSGMSLDDIDAINLTGAEVLVGSLARGGVAPLVDTKGIGVTVRNFAVTPMRVRDWQAESKLSGVTLALSGWKEPIAFRTGQFNLSGGKLNAQFVADLATAADIKGTLNVPDFEHPEVNFEMSSSQLDIDKLIEVASGSPGVPTSPAPAKPVADPPAEKNQLVARGHINVERIRSKPYTVGPANLEMRVFTDRAELWPASIGVYGGTLQVSSRVDRATEPPRFTANVQMRDVDVAKVLDVTPAARGKMGGTAELDLQLLGNLNAAWKKTLSGTGKFAIRNGHLPGVNLAGAAESALKMAGVGADTPFSVLGGDLTIANQRVSSKQIHLDSPSGVVDLRGNLGLDGALDYQGVATVNPAGALGSGAVGAIVGGFIGSKVGKVTVPFALAGTVESPKVRPGQGVPSFGPPATATGSTPSSAPPSPPTTPQEAIDTLKGLFNKKK